MIGPLSKFSHQPSPVKIAHDSNQKILVLPLWRGRFEAEHMDVVREMTEFYYRKGARGLRVGLGLVKWRLCVQEERDKFLFLVVFISSLT
jgi:hypothetical protein